jgi:hypothetical protein
MGSSRGRLAIVSLHAHRQLAPRGERTRRLVEGFSADWDVDLIAPAPTVATGGAAGSGGSSRLRRLAAGAVDWVLLDKWEPWSAHRLVRWRPDVDAAVLIGHPFSPLVYAARRLVGAEVPYVVDVGDPWILTNLTPFSRGLALWRARRGERQLWEGAAGAVLTTWPQADRLLSLFPSLEVIVRPNGYEAIAGHQAGVGSGGGPQRPSREAGVLRIAHFGMLSSQRLDPRPFLRSLGESGIWDRVVIAQFGDDFSGTLDDPPPNVEVERLPAYPWETVVEFADDYDIALVVGNLDGAQLPSKAVQYLTLPLPRLALIEDPGDSLSLYVRDMPGWAVVRARDPGAPAIVVEHLAKPRPPGALDPPAEESWNSVARTIVEFVEGCVGRRDAAGARV